MASIDLPHKPSDPQYLYDRAQNMLEKLVDAVEDIQTAPSVSIQSYIVRKSYGAKISIAWMVPSGEYCRCQHQGTCPERAHGPFSVKRTVYRIKSDFTLEAFEHGLRSEHEFSFNFTPSERRAPLLFDV